MNPLSLVLAIGLVYGIGVIVGLLRPSPNQASNRILAGLVFAVTLKLVPYVLGFSGMYQRYPWLSFAPFEIDAAFGPLLYLYVLSLTRAPIKRNFIFHFVPAIIEFCYYAIMFVQPLGFKNAWHDRAHSLIDPAEYAFGVISLAVYLIASMVRTVQYQKLTLISLTQAEPQTIRFLSIVLKAFAAYVAIRLVFGISQILQPKTSLDNFYLAYFWLAILIFVLGAGALTFKEVIPSASQPEALTDSEANASAKDWSKIADQIADRTEQGQLWLDPQLSLPTFAERVGFSPGYVSKALNVGRAQNFSDFINQYRVNRVNELLADPAEDRDVLELAFECGFNSKASFNRIYKKLTNETPSQARARLRTG